MPHPADKIPWHLYNDYPTYDFFVDDLITVSESNRREHWGVISKRHNNQKSILIAALQSYKPTVVTPAHVVFERHNSRLLDHDNLTISYKNTKDYFCNYLLPGLQPGRADAKLDITFSYDQCKSKRKGTKITIYNRKNEE